MARHLDQSSARTCGDADTQVVLRADLEAGGLTGAEHGGEDGAGHDDSVGGAGNLVHRDLAVLEDGDTDGHDGHANQVAWPFTHAM